MAGFDEADLLKWVSSQENLVRGHFFDNPLRSDTRTSELLLGFNKVLSYLKNGPAEELPICISNDGKLLRLDELASHLRYNELYIIYNHPYRTEEKEGISQQKF